MGNFEDNVIKPLNNLEMQQDLIKDKSSQFNKKVRPAISRLNAVRTTKIKPIKQKIQNVLAQQDSANMDALKKDIVEIYNPKATIKSIEKDKKY